MTLKGQKNHYNIKFLKGYGHSISVKNSKIILKNGRHDITGEQESEEWLANLGLLKGFIVLPEFRTLYDVLMINLDYEVSLANDSIGFVWND